MKRRRREAAQWHRPLEPHSSKIADKNDVAPQEEVDGTKDDSGGSGSIESAGSFFQKTGNWKLECCRCFFIAASSCCFIDVVAALPLDAACSAAAMGPELCTSGTDRRASHAQTSGRGDD
jgi:hypothetical protein